MLGLYDLNQLLQLLLVIPCSSNTTVIIQNKKQPTTITLSQKRKRKFESEMNFHGRIDDLLDRNVKQHLKSGVGDNMLPGKTLHHSFHMDLLRDRCLVSVAEKHNGVDLLCKLQPPRPCENTDTWQTDWGWLVLSKDSTLYGVNTWRCREILTYTNLMRKYRLPTDVLTIPIRVNARNLGNEDLFNLLLTLSRSDTKGETTLDSHTYFTDDHLLLNGFELRFNQGGRSGDRVEIYRMTTLIKDYNIPDLVEILHMICDQRKNQSNSMAAAPGCCRPRKVQAYIKELASKVSLGSETVADRMEVQDMLGELRCSDQKNAVCIHGKPWCEIIYKGIDALYRDIDTF